MHQFLSKFYIALSFLSISVSGQQVVVSSTHFTGRSVLNETFHQLDIVENYGFVPGTLTTILPFTKEPDNFASGDLYLIAPNPKSINPNYVDRKDTMFIFNVSSDPLTSARILNYHLEKLKPYTQVTINIDYMNIIDTTKTSSCLVNNFKVWINKEEEEQFPVLVRGEKVVENLRSNELHSFSMTGLATSKGKLDLSIEALQLGECGTYGISKIEISGTPDVKGIIEQGDQACFGDLIRAIPLIKNNGKYQWEISDQMEWRKLDSTYLLEYNTKDTGQYFLRYQFTPEGTLSNLVSDSIPLNVTACCRDSISGMLSPNFTIFYDDFGTLVDSTGDRFKVWDYSDPVHPQHIEIPSDSKYRLQSEVPIIGCSFSAEGPVNDQHYTIAANMTRTNLNWANNIGGYAQSPSIGYDHSGKWQGAALLINIPGILGPIYRRTFDLCNNSGNILFEFFINVFTQERFGVDLDVILNGGGATKRIKAVASSSFSGGNGQWVYVSSEVEMIGNKLTLELINNSAIMISGNDLVIDDIKIKTCNHCSPLTNLKNTSTFLRKLYPNPTIDKLYYSGSAKSFTVINILGEVILQSYKAEFLDVNHLPAGLYNIRVQEENDQIYSENVIVE